LGIVPDQTAFDGPLSVLHVCAPAHVGGLERVVQGLSIGGKKHGQRVGILAVVEPGTDCSAFLDPVTAAGVETTVFTVSARAYLREWRIVRRFLKKFKPHVVHTHGYRSDLLHGGSARSLGIATVSTLHGSSRMGGISHLFEWIQEWVLGRFDAVVAVSEPLVDTLVARGIHRERVHTVPNAWTPQEVMVPRDQARKALRSVDDEVLIGWVGRLIPVKGCDVFLRALTRLPDHGWRATVVGDGPERSGLERLAASLGLPDRVHFTGAIPDAARLFEGLDLFVLSSRSEGTPMVLLEAMGAGVPVVVTSVGGVPDVVRSPSDGWVVEPEDPAALGRALHEALDDPSVRASRSRSAHQRIHDSFDFDSWILRHVEVYRAAMRVRTGGV
jgi:glycosyltransferase involved in cell wall biosynthesis